MKIGIVWADVSNRLTAAEVLAHCDDHGLREDSTEHCTMGVDTGKELHVVVSRWISGRQGEKREVVWILRRRRTIRTKPKRSDVDRRGVEE